MTDGAAGSDLRIEETEPEDGAATILTVRLDAPRRRNALTLETVCQLEQVLTERPDGPLVLGSTTPGIFSAGADLSIDDASRVQLSDRLYACYALMVTRPGPVLAAVDGPAVGGGAQLATAADLRTASPRARWRWVGPGHGLAVGAWILPELLGRARGLDLALTGRWLEAEEALTAGLVSALTADPWRRALRLAARLAELDAEALARVKQIATRPALLERLADERRRNHASWSGGAPSAAEAARQGRSAAID